MELLEMVVIQIGEETTRSHRMLRNLKIMNVLIPVRADLIYRRHARHYTIGAANHSDLWR